MSKDTDIMMRAVADVLKARLSSKGFAGTHHIEFPGPQVTNEVRIDTQALAEAMGTLHLPPAQVTNEVNLSLTPLVEAIFRMAEQLTSTRPQVNMDVKPLVEVVKQMKEAENKQNELISQLIKTLRDQPSPTVVMPKLLKSTTKVVRDSDGDMKSTETTYEYED